ncbi:hypothetical protein GMOD_00001826 [Pyrenophora seminiperda CCB06]|uniref:Ubiquitin-like protease family profile domain-containing protein n=1 Tax=Pyrenophora seminiperda CCB06 TaxID=1302712 RepID=A0A3M7LWC8_9PLEO|nr:hypothetical protein GMOD_00001826 [Pyrenophora seminiperda CCB06]
MNHPRLTITVPKDLARIFPIASPILIDANLKVEKFPKVKRAPPVTASERVNGATTCFVPRHFITTTAQDSVVENSWSDAQQGFHQDRPTVPLNRRWSVDTSTCRPDPEKWIYPNSQVHYDALEQGGLFQRNYNLATGPIPEDIIYESQNASLSFSEFLDICKAGTPGWFTDSMVDTSFDVLSHVARCEENGVSLLPVSMATQLYRIGQQNENGIDEGVDRQLLDKIIGKTYVLVPISDGYKASLEWGFQQATLGALPLSNVRETGSHWTLLAVEIHNSQLVGHYFDSMPSRDIKQTENCKAARYVLTGLQKALNITEKPRMIRARHAPRQTTAENRAYKIDGSGACGPFIWEMSKQICQYIADCYENFTCDVDISVPVGFCDKLQWDSMQTRQTIRSLILRELRIRTHLNGRRQWMDERALGLKGWNTWLREHGKPSHYFWDPRASGIPSEYETESDN